MQNKCHWWTHFQHYLAKGAAEQSISRKGFITTSSEQHREKSIASHNGSRIGKNKKGKALFLHRLCNSLRCADTWLGALERNSGRWSLPSDGPKFKTSYVRVQLHRAPCCCPEKKGNCTGKRMGSKIFITLKTDPPACFEDKQWNMNNNLTARNGWGNNSFSTETNKSAYLVNRKRYYTSATVLAETMLICQRGSYLPLSDMIT
jgi:hypothetical protein